MRQREIPFLLWMCVSAFLLSSCQNQTILGGDTSLIESTVNEREIVIWHTYGEYESYVFEEVLIPQFEAEYPTIRVKSVRQPYKDELRTEIISRISAKEPPDVVRMDIVWLPTFAALDLLYPLDEFDDFQEVKERFYEEPLKTNIYNERYYGVPLNTNTKIAIYNKEIQEATQAGQLKTMEELIDFIEEHNLVIGINSLSIWDSLQYFYGLGGQLTNEEFSQATGYLNSPQSLEAAEKLVSLFEKGSMSISTNSIWHSVMNGSFFMIDDGPWFYSNNSEEQMIMVNEQTTSTPFPISYSKRGILGGENLVITKHTDYKEEAWTFIKWMTSVEPQLQLAQTGLIPSNQNVELTGFYDKYPYYQAYLDSLDDAILRPIVPRWWEIEEIYGKYFTAIVAGEIDIERGLTEAAEKIDKVLAVGKQNSK